MFNYQFSSIAAARHATVANDYDDMAGASGRKNRGHKELVFTTSDATR